MWKTDEEKGKELANALFTEFMALQKELSQLQQEFAEQRQSGLLQRGELLKLSKQIQHLIEQNGQQEIRLVTVESFGEKLQDFKEALIKQEELSERIAVQSERTEDILAEISIWVKSEQEKEGLSPDELRWIVEQRERQQQVDRQMQQLRYGLIEKAVMGLAALLFSLMVFGGLFLLNQKLHEVEKATPVLTE